LSEKLRQVFGEAAIKIDFMKLEFRIWNKRIVLTNKFHTIQDSY